MAKILQDEGPVDIARKKTKADDMVLFTVDTGQVSRHDLWMAIHDDGRRRNLRWQLTGTREEIIRVYDDKRRLGDGISEDKADVETSESYDSRGAARRRHFWPARYIISFKNARRPEGLSENGIAVHFRCRGNMF